MTNKPEYAIFDAQPFGGLSAVFQDRATAEKFRHKLSEKLANRDTSAGKVLLENAMPLISRVHRGELKNTWVVTLKGYMDAEEVRPIFDQVWDEIVAESSPAAVAA